MNANFDDLATKITSLESSVNSLSTSVNTNATNVATAQALPLSGTAKGLRIYNQTTYPNSQMVVTASELIVANASYQAKHLSSVNLTLDLTVSGANGLDTGTEAVSTWYHLWVIHNPTANSTAGLFSSSSTAPTLPTGYSHYAYVGAAYNESTGDLMSLTQVGKKVSINSSLGLRGFPQPTSGGWLSVSLATAIPTTATTASGFLNVVGFSPWIYLGPKSGFYYFCDGIMGNSLSQASLGSFQIPIETPQQLFAVFNGTSASIYISGWEFE